MMIVRASTDVFTKHGYEKASVEDLLKGAGIARRTFYKYFRNKAEVLAALYKHVTGELVLNIVEASGDVDDLFAGLRLALDRALDFYVENDAIVRILVEEATRSESPLWPLRERFRATLVQMIDRAMTAATGQRIDPLVFLALVSGLEGLTLELLDDGTPSDQRVARTKAVMLGLLDVVENSATDLPPRPSEIR